MPVDPTGSQRLRRSVSIEKVAGRATGQPQGANVGLIGAPAVVSKDLAGLDGRGMLAERLLRVPDRSSLT